TDKIDLTGIDANTTHAGPDAFTFRGSAAFSGQAGDLHTVYDSVRNVTVLEGDTNGDGTADFGIELNGNVTLTTVDFTAGSLAVPLNLVGGPGNAPMTGGVLDDTLDGRGGAHTMTGGRGNDTYYVDDAGDQVVEQSGSAYSAPSGW